MAEQHHAFEIIGGADYWMDMVKCQDACPVHTDACGYVTAIAEGRYEDAYRLARARNPFASICGRVCGAPCEANCRRGDLDAPVAIRALKRFVTEQFGPDTGNLEMHRDAYDPYMLPQKGDYERVAVVGAGVAGLTVAHDLARTGYKVTVFEGHDKPGGMLTAGVPVFRLPRELVRNEIEAILSLGVELKCNMRLGRDFTLSSLRADGFKAIFLGIGLQKGRKLQIPGADLPRVYDGMDFLRAFNEGKPLPVGKRVVVIGGGNVAYDVARSAVRPVDAVSGAEAVGEIERSEHVAYDAARSIMRLSSDKEVHVVCLEGRSEMPADAIEVHEGAEEGIVLHNSRGPRAILESDGKVTGLRTVKCASVFDASGRFNPTFDESCVEDIPADTILFAIGQSSDLSFLQPNDNIETERGLIKVDPETYQTSAPDVFACGDVAHGPRLFINAIASAQIAARSVHDFLRGTRTDVIVRSAWKPAAYAMAEGWERMEREAPPLVGAETRATSLVNIEHPYTPDAARRQGARCLRCNVNTVFDTGMCVGCRGCVDVCPERLIRLVGISDLAADETGRQFAANALGITTAEVGGLPGESLDELGGIMLKDESTCIRCGLCASRCPTHAITMKRFEFRRECVTYPSQNPKLKYHPNGTRPVAND